MNNKQSKVVIYGGNGFVGTHIAKKLAYLDKTNVVCVSRRGHKPLHLTKNTWSERVRWCKGDASEPQQKTLKNASVLISTVGAAPLPTLSKASFDKQLFANGTCNEHLIQSAQDAGIKRLILLGASIPWVMQHNFFAYAKGKKISLEAAKRFAEQSDQHQALVLQPGAIYGKRYLANGKAIPLDWFMKPMALIMPSQFTDINRISERVHDAVSQADDYTPGLTVLGPKEI